MALRTASHTVMARLVVQTSSRARPVYWKTPNNWRKVGAGGESPAARVAILADTRPSIGPTRRRACEVRRWLGAGRLCRAMKPGQDSPPSSEITDESVYLRRREFVRQAGLFIATSTAWGAGL